MFQEVHFLTLEGIALDKVYVQYWENFIKVDYRDNLYSYTCIKDFVKDYPHVHSGIILEMLEVVQFENHKKLTRLQKFITKFFKL